MTKLSDPAYGSYTGTPADTDTVTMLVGGRNKQVPVPNLIRRPVVTVGTSKADFILSGTADQNIINQAITAAAGYGRKVYIRDNAFVTGSIVCNYPNFEIEFAPGVNVTATASFNGGIIESTGQPTSAGGLTKVTVKGGILNPNNLANVQAIVLKGGAYNASDVPFIDTFHIYGTSLSGLGSTNGAVGLLTLKQGRSSSMGDFGPISNVRLWNVDFGATSKYHVYINGPDLDTIFFNFVTFHNGATPFSFGWNTPSARSDTLSRARSNKDANFIHCIWKDMNLTAAAGYTINDTARTGWQGMHFDHCRVEGHSIDFTAAPTPANEEIFMNVHGVHELTLDYVWFKDIKTLFSIGQSNNGPYYQSDATVGMWMTNCHVIRCYNFCDFDAATRMVITGNIFYELYYGSVSLGYGQKNLSIFAHNTIYNSIGSDQAAPDTPGLRTAGLSLLPHGWHIFDNTLRDDRLLPDPTTKPVLSAVTSAGAPGGTYYVAYSWWNDTGETLLSDSETITVASGQTVKTLHPYTSSYGPPDGAKRVNFYAGTSPISLTLQDYMPLPSHLDEETDHYTTYKEAYWQMPASGLTTGAVAPAANTTHTRMRFGIHEVSGADGPLLPNVYHDNHFYGITTKEMNVQSTYKRISYNNWTNRTITTNGEQRLESIPFAIGNTSGALTIDVKDGEKFTFTAIGNITLAVAAGHYVGQRITLEMTQDVTGSRTLSKPSNVLLAGGAFSPSAAAGSVCQWVLECTNVTSGTWKEYSRTTNMS